LLIDFHTHVGNSIFEYKQTPTKLFANMKKYGIEKAVICPVKPYTYHLETQNNYIAKLVKKYPEKLIGFCRVDPRLKVKAVKEVIRCSKELNLKGIFLHPWEETFQINDEIVIPIIQEAENNNMLVMISGGHLRVSRAWQISELTSKFPKVNFIITSAGQINISGSALFEAEIMIKENLNIIVETSGIYREDFIEEIVKKYGKDRVIFGSNSPEYNLGLEIKRVQWAHLSQDEIDAISYQNALRILKP